MGKYFIKKPTVIGAVEYLGKYWAIMEWNSGRHGNKGKLQEYDVKNNRLLSSYHDIEDIRNFSSLHIIFWNKEKNTASSSN